MFPTNDDLAHMLIELTAKTDTNREILLTILSSGDVEKKQTLSEFYTNMDEVHSQAIRMEIADQDIAEGFDLEA